MRHRGGEMMLTETELCSVVEALTGAHPTSVALRVYLRVYADVTRVAQAATVSADARVLVRHLETSAPEALLKILLDIGVNNRDVMVVAERYRGAIAAKADGST